MVTNHVESWLGKPLSEERVLYDPSCWLSSVPGRRMLPANMLDCKSGNQDLDHCVISEDSLLVFGSQSLY